MCGHARFQRGGGGSLEVTYSLLASLHSLPSVHLEGGEKGTVSFRRIGFPSDLMRECLPIQIGPWIPLIRAYLYLGRLVLHLLSLPGLLVAYLGVGGGQLVCLSPPSSLRFPSSLVSFFQYV